MLRRLATTYLSLLVAILLTLGIPLGTSSAERESQDMFIARLTDTARFASVAELALREGHGAALEGEIRRNDELYGFAVLIVDRGGSIVFASRDPIRLQTATYRDQVQRALVGISPDKAEIAWPWRDDPLVIALPIGRDSQVIGAAVTISETGELRARILRRWGLLALGGLFALGWSVIAALAVARWVLRPVHDLDAVAHEITLGHLDARVSPGAGPDELRRLKTAFNAMADQVAALLDRQRALVADVSHQLRNPLTALRLQIDSLETHLSGEGRRTYRSMVEEVERLAGILDDLLLLARTEAAAPDMAPVDLPSLVATRLGAWASLYAQRGVPLRQEGVPTRPVLAMPAMLDQMLDALLDNALKYADGAPVTVRLSEAVDHVDLHVVDAGPGLSDEGRAHATERFWRGDSHQSVPGTGLGLAIVSAAAEHCHAHLDLLPGVPRGLDARVRLRAAPAGPALNGEPPGSNAGRPGGAATGTSRSRTGG